MSKVEQFEAEDLLVKRRRISRHADKYTDYISCRRKIPTRFWIGLMVFATTYINYTIRVNVSVSIVAMVQPKVGKEIPECKLREMNQTREETTVPPGITLANITDHHTTESPLKKLEDSGPRYNWNQFIQGIIIGSYFWGYTISSLPGGFISEWLGPVKVIFWVHLISAVFNSLTVFSAWGHWGLVVLCRMILGFGAGLVYPALQCLIARWAPPAEKGKFVAALMGNTLGTCITWPLVGQVTQSFGWDWGYHVVSLQNVIFCVIFIIVAADSPDQHKWIGEDEKNFIKEAQGGAVSKKKAVPPYFRMFTSLSFWMLAILHFGNLWGLYLQLTGIPKFMAEVIGFNLKNSGGLAALPHLARLFLGTGFGIFGDFLKKKGTSDKFIRKFFVLFSHIIPGLLLIAIAFIGCNWIPIVILLTLSMSVNGAAVLTNLRNPQDLAPNFAGTIFGIISFTGGMTGFITPAVTSALTESNNGVDEWSWNFILGGSVYIFCGAMFILFGSVKRQPWNEKQEEDNA